jgi:hypothetical protein
MTFAVSEVPPSALVLVLEIPIPIPAPDPLPLPPPPGDAPHDALTNTPAPRPVNAPLVVLGMADAVDAVAGHHRMWRVGRCEHVQAAGRRRGPEHARVLAEAEREWVGGLRAGVGPRGGAGRGRVGRAVKRGRRYERQLRVDVWDARGREAFRVDAQERAEARVLGLEARDFTLAHLRPVHVGLGVCGLGARGGGGISDSLQLGPRT